MWLSLQQALTKKQSRKTIWRLGRERSEEHLGISHDEMAEAVVGLVIDKLISMLTEEAKLLKGVDKEVDAIKSELQSILAFLRDADRRADTEGDTISDGGRLWVEELRKVAFQIEDVTDEYTLHIPQWSQQTQQRSLRL